MTEEGRGSSGDHERDYRALVERLRALIAERVPTDGRVLVVTRGDEALLRLPGRDAGHFPQSETGLYAGYHPADGSEAVSHLEELKAKGAKYLAIPAIASWWLESYPELRSWLEEHGELVAEESATCVVFALQRRTRKRPRTREELEAARTAPQVEALIRAVLPRDDPLVLVGAAAPAVDPGARRCWRLPAPGPDVPVEELIARLDAARREGARYAVLLNPDDPSEHIDGRLRRHLELSLRPVFGQRLAEAYELDPSPED